MRLPAWLIAAIVLTLIVIAWFWPVALQGRLPSGGDATALHLPQMLQYDEALDSGRIPLWNDQVAFGDPVHARGQIGVYYPLHLLLYGLLPGATAYGLSILLHMLLASWFAYLCGRWFELGRPAAILVAIVFTGQGFFINHLEHPWSYTTGCWIPLAIGLTWRWLRDSSWRSLVVLVGILAIQLLAGHFQLALYTQAFVLLLALVASSAAQGERGSWCARTLALPLALVGAFLLAAIQLIPTTELLMVTDLRGRGMDFLGSFATAPIHLVNYLVPTLMQSHPLWQGVAWDPWHTSARECLHYAGLLPLGLAARSILNGVRDRRVCICGVMWIITVLLMIGPYLPGFSLLTQLPPFGFFTATARWSVFGGLMLGLMAGISLDQMRWESFRSWLLKFAAVTALLTALVIAVLAIASGNVESFRKPLSQVPSHHLLEYGYTAEQSQSPSLTPYRELPSMLRSELGVPIVNLVLLLLIVALARRTANRDTLIFATLLVVVVDLGLTAQQLRRVGFDKQMAAPNQVRVLQELEKYRGQRVITPLAELASLSGVIPLSRPSIPDMEIYWDPGFGPYLVNIWGTSFPTIPAPQRWQDVDNKVGYLADNLDNDQLELMRIGGVRQIVLGPYSMKPHSELPLDHQVTVTDTWLTSRFYGNYVEKLPAANQQWSFWSIAAEKSVARAWAFPVTDPAEPGSDPRWQTVPPPARRNLLESAVPADEVQDLGEAVIVRGTAPSRSVLVLTDLDYPGWTAELEMDGKVRQVEIEPAFGGWRGVLIPDAGRYELRFKYQPASLRVGRTTSLLALLGWLICLAGGWAIDRKAKPK